MKRLLVMRHAKSDWSGGVADHDRPLSRRGSRAAASMGELLRRMEEVPDLVYSSTAVRALDTAQLAAAAGRWPAPIETSPDLYATSVAATLEVAARAPDRVARLMLVGHQPAWGALVGHLTGGAVQIRTGTIAAIDCYAASWRDLPRSGGELAYLLQPRLFTDASGADG